MYGRSIRSMSLVWSILVTVSFIYQYLRGRHVMTSIPPRLTSSLPCFSAVIVTNRVTRSTVRLREMSLHCDPLIWGALWSGAHVTIERTKLDRLSRRLAPIQNDIEGDQLAVYDSPAQLWAIISDWATPTCWPLPHPDRNDRQVGCTNLSPSLH